MKTRVLSALVALAFALAIPFSGAWAASPAASSPALAASPAWAASGDLDEIVDYRIKVDVNDDATLTMVYHIDWKVLDSTSDGPLTWVRIGIPNKHYTVMEGLSSTVKSIRYDSSGGSYARIDLDRAYYAGEVVSFDFKLVQDYMYQVGRDNQGEAVYEFTPGWFDDIVVDKLQISWNANKVERIAPAAQQAKGYYTWTKSLRKGERFTVTVGYPDNAFAFDIDKTIEKGSGQSGYSSYDDEDDWFYGLIACGILIAMIWGFVGFVKGIVSGITNLFDKGSGFKATKKKITRTKVVYYPVCQGCGAARPEGEDTCAYCGRSFIQSEEVIEEKDIPAEESAIKSKNTDGEYAYSSEPNTFLRVHVVSVPISLSNHGRGRSSEGSCACASSCACACGCACACACAGGGRAGCTTKDFYNTNLKLSQLDMRKRDTR